MSEPVTGKALRRADAPVCLCGSGQKCPHTPSASYYLRPGYNFEAKKDLVKGSSLPGRLFREYCITMVIVKKFVVEVEVVLELV